MAPQHASLSPERWSRFSLDQQVLMIANEMNRARKLLDNPGALRNCYERVLRLTDLTIQVTARRGLRREVLRWRDLIAELYQCDQPRPAAHQQAFRCLLRFTAAASQQIPLLLDGHPAADR